MVAPPLGLLAFFFLFFLLLMCAVSIRGCSSDWLPLYRPIDVSDMSQSAYWFADKGAESFDGRVPFGLASRATCFFVTYVRDASGEYVDRLAVGQTRFELDIRGSAAGRGIRCPSRR